MLLVLRWKIIHVELPKEIMQHQQKQQSNKPERSDKNNEATNQRDQTKTTKQEIKNRNHEEGNLRPP